LFTAVERGNFAGLMSVFATQGEDITARGGNGTTLLHVAAKRSNWRLIDWLMTNIRDFPEVREI
jgi:hypothetical protein